MANIPCLTAENRCFPCAGDSSNPFANLSIEPFDLNVWLNVYFGVVTNVVPNSWTTDTCVGFCESSISQIDADDCARRRALECLHVPPLPPIPPEPPPLPPPQIQAICNQEVTCESGGNCYTVPACTIFAATQMEANAIAASLCEARVNNPETTAPCTGPLPPEPPPPTPEPPLDATCGVPTYIISGYNPTIAQSILDLMPSSNDSFLPEWDGVFRNDGETGYKLHSECYSILGKEIELEVVLNQSFIQEVNCTFGGNPGFWNHSAGPGDCAFCSDNLEFTFFGTDKISISNGIDTTQLLVNQAMGGVGTYQLYVGPSCNSFVGPFESYHVTGDVALPTIGPAIFSVTAIP